MNHPAPSSEQTAPQAFRDTLAALAQIGLKVAQMIGHVADAETTLAETAAKAGAAEGASAMAASLAEAIEADRAAAAAGEMRHTVVARAQAVAAAYARVSRAIRLTILLAERLDRGWARGGAPDDRHAMAQRQIARGVADALRRETESDQPGAFTERLETLDTERGIGDRSTEAILAEIYNALGLDPARMTVSAPQPNKIRVTATNGLPRWTGPKPAWQARPPQRNPDG
jgi:hypothetical protein